MTTIERSLFNLIQIAKENDQESMVEVISKFQPTIRKFSRMLKYEEAETDLTIALLEIVKYMKLEKLKSQNDGVIVNYIYNVLRNKKNKLFHKHVKGIKEDMELDLNIVDAEMNYISGDIFLVETALSILSDMQRKILIQKFIEGYSEAEIAKKLNISRQAVNRRKNRAFRKIRKKFNI